VPGCFSREIARKRGEEKAQEGAALAADCGIDASAKVCARSGTVAETTLGVAEEANADAIVLGPRGLTGIESLLIGSVAHAVIQSSDRPVVSVPSPKVIETRSQKAHEHTQTAI
jgi:nucleotide-binding universal stress UspA family protein